MEYKKLDRKIIDGWRTSRLIRLACFLLPTLAATIFVDTDAIAWKVAFYLLWAICAYCLLGLILYPPIEYRQWGYYIDDEKVVIRHGLFFISQTIIPVIRIQNITVSQGPINRHLGLYKVEIALASGSHEIVGLDQETADAISESLRVKLYHRMEAKGEL
jgi:membrane protein YdbS with pleckstrin-like domain